MHQLTCDNWMPQNQSNFGPKLQWFCEVALICICCRPWMCTQMPHDLLNHCILNGFLSPAFVICKATVKSEEWVVKLKTRKTVCRRMRVSPRLPCNKWTTEYFLAVILHQNIKQIPVQYILVSINNDESLS